MKEHVLWVEKYRPSNVDECILTSSVRDVFNGIISEGVIPNLILFGGAGCGKTSVAKALCEQLDNHYLFLNGSLGGEESGIEAFRTRVRTFASSMSFNGKRKIVIIDEADNLPPASQTALRALIEEFAKNCSYIFTCNNKNRLIEPIHSRCCGVEFKITKKDKQGIATSFLKKSFDILDKENVKYDKKAVAEFLMRYFPDFRRCLMELQTFSRSSGNIIDVGILAKNENLDFDHLVKSLKNKDFESVRKWVVESLSEDSTRVYRMIYDNLSKYMKKHSIPPFIILYADYQYKSVIVQDQEPQLLSFLTELMADDIIEFI